MPQKDYYYHPPGQISRWGVVDVGLKGPHSCAWCYYAYWPDGTAEVKKFAGMRRAEWKDTAALVAQIDTMADNGFLGFDITGGEPSVFPGIVDIVRHASNRGLSTRMITLGQFLGTRGLLDRLLEAGLTDMLFSYHTADPALFHELTGGQLSKMHEAMNELGRLGFEFGTNTTCIGNNYKALPDLARSICSKNVYVSNLIVMNAYYGWADGRASEVRARYVDIAPYLRRAVDILENEGGVAVNIRYTPMCAVAGLEKNLAGILGVRYDPHEWANTVRHFGPAGGAAEGQWVPMRQGEPSPGSTLLFGADPNVPVGRGFENRLMKVFAPQCQGCAALKVCDGIDQTYLQQMGADEFVPYAGDERGDVLDKDRLAYHPAYLIKRRPKARMKNAVARMMGKRPLSPEPLVSVVVANYNYGQYLPKCLDSILAQTWKNIEIVVVDDCSADHSREVLKTYEDRCRIIYRPTNSGNPCYPHNEAIALTKGELVMYLDPDDWIEPSYIEEGIRKLRRHPEASVVYPGISIFGSYERIVPASPYDINRLILANFIPCCSLYRREMWEETGGYVDNVKGADDWNMWVAGASMGYLGAPLPRQLFHYFAKPDGLYERESKPNLARRLKQVILNNSDAYPPDTIRWAKQRSEPPVQKSREELNDELFRSLSALETSGELQEIVNCIQQSGLEKAELVFTLYRLLMEVRFRTSFVLSKMLAASGETHPLLYLAQSFSGALFNLPEDEAVGTGALVARLRQMPQAAQTTFHADIVTPIFARLKALDDASTLSRLQAIITAAMPQ